MREYLFKAKRKDNGEWVEGFIYRHDPPLVCFTTDLVKPPRWFILQTAFADWNMPRQVEFIEVIPETICEFTGTFDKNGTKVFEWDKLGSMSNFVEYLDGDWCINGDRPLSWFRDYEVTGNKFD